MSLANRIWAETECPHVNTIKTITREAFHETCEDCGAERLTFAIEPHIKEGQSLVFRAKDFEAEGTHSLAELKEQAMRDTYGPDDFDDIDSGIYSPEKLKKTLADNAHLREQLALQLAQIRERADERDAAQADNARLRALIAAQEWGDGDETGPRCPWCSVVRYEQPHATVCPAFTPEGAVR